MVHRLNRSVEETLYPALEDFELDIVIGKGPAAFDRLNLEPFTLVGANMKQMFGAFLRISLIIEDLIFGTLIYLNCI